MHLTASKNGNCVYAMHTKVFQTAKLRGKQTNKHAAHCGGTRMVQTTPLLTACQSCWSPPLDPDPPLALLMEQSPRCVSQLWGVGLGERCVASTVATIEAIRAR